jgi:3-oxoacyl-[acyl-carrier-protein] synthase III
MTVEDWAKRHGYAGKHSASLRASGHSQVYVANGLSTVDMACFAVDRLIKSTPRFDPLQVEVIIYCCSTQHTVAPAPFSAPVCVQGEFGFKNAKCFSICQLNCVSILAALKVARALLSDGRVRGTVLVVSSDRECNEDYRISNDFTVITSDAASAVLVTSDATRNRIGPISIRNYSALNGGASPAATQQNTIRQRLIEWTAIHDVVSSSMKEGLDQGADFLRLLPSNMAARGWLGIAKRLGRESDFVYTKNVSDKGHTCCADPIINLLDSGGLDLPDSGAVVVGCQSNNGAYGAMTLYGKSSIEG